MTTAGGRRRGVCRAGVVFAGCVAAALSAGCAVSNGLVGGECAEGYAACNDQCVEVTSDPNNCGACGHSCGAGQCVGGGCTSAVDARADGPTDAKADRASDGPAGDGKTGDVASSDGPPGDVGHGDASDTGRSDVSSTDGPPSDAPQETGPTDGKLPDGEVQDAAPDGPLPDGTLLDGQLPDGKLPDGKLPDGWSGDAPGDTGPADATGDQCAPPYVTASNCGGCGVVCSYAEVCSPPAPDSGADAGSYSCITGCFLPYHQCGSDCVDEDSDPSNCGSCGASCPLGLCVNATCAGTVPGQIVVIGDDYAAPNVLESEANILSNAVFLPLVSPLQILSFEQYSSAAQVATVKKVIHAAAVSLGRGVDFTVLTDYSALATSLAPSEAPDGAVQVGYHVLLVYDQPNAPSGQLATVGSTWSTPVGDFLAAGGEVIVLDGASGVGQMPSLLKRSGLLATSGHVRVRPPAELNVVAWGDSVGNGVPSPYAAQADTVYFLTSELNGGDVTYVVDFSGDLGTFPVVIHKMVQ